ncbi:MAG: hypothetical protein ACXW1P_02525 [Methylophilaceae bacterium]
MNNKIVLLVVCTALILTGCAAEVIHAEKKAGFNYHLEHIHIVYIQPKQSSEFLSRNAEHTKYAYTNLAKNTLEELPIAFQKIGITSHTVQIEKSSKRVTPDRLIELFPEKYEGPIMIIEPIYADTTCSYNLQGSGGCSTEFTVRSSLADFSSGKQKTVWSVTIALPPRTMYVFTYSGVAEKLANKTLEKLKADKVLD